MSPDETVISDTLGWIHYKIGTYATALELLKEANEKFKGSNPTVLYHLGVVYDKTGDKKQAREALKKALAVNPNFSESAEAKKLLKALGG